MKVGFMKLSVPVAPCFGIGEDSGQPVTPDYKLPFKLNGKIEKVVFDVK